MDAEENLRHKDEGYNILVRVRARYVSVIWINKLLSV
jgi:hypothetical protein